MDHIPERALSIELLNARNAWYTLDSFDSGDAELDDFLENDALNEQHFFSAELIYVFIRIMLQDSSHWLRIRFGWIKINWIPANTLMAVITLHIHAS